MDKEYKEFHFVLDWRNVGDLLTLLHAVADEPGGWIDLVFRPGYTVQTKVGVVEEPPTLEFEVNAFLDKIPGPATMIAFLKYNITEPEPNSGVAWPCRVIFDLDFLKTMNVEVVDNHFECQECEKIWTPPWPEEDGKLPDNYWRCPNGCNKDIK